MFHAFPRVAIASLAIALALGSLQAEEKPRPLFKDFAGLCVHTVQFKPDLYRPVTGVVRNYHPLKWDVGEDTRFKTTFPFARNRVDWTKVYGPWKTAGYDIEASILFDDFKPEDWKDIKADAYAYGKAFAQFFGPSNQGLVAAAEIGNEPGKYEDATYRDLFEAMARGMREGDPKLQIAPCAMNLGKSGRYSKSVDVLKGLGDLWDIMNIHIYPEVEGWPTWRRSYPEDPKIEFLRDLDHVLAWREKNAPGKPVWLTEWGYDSSTKPAPKEGTFSKWVGNSDEQQAMWIVRGYLVLAATSLDRAYLYFFNDNDTPHVHGSSGLTRDFQPKPSFHAVAHLQKTIGEYRFSKSVQGDPETGYVQEWTHGEEPSKRVSICWVPAGGERELTLAIPKNQVTSAQRMPLSDASPESVELIEADGVSVRAKAGPAPIYVTWTAKE